MNLHPCTVPELVNVERVLDRMKKARRADGGKGVDLISTAESLDTGSAFSRQGIFHIARKSGIQIDGPLSEGAQDAQKRPAATRPGNFRSSCGYCGDRLNWDCKKNHPVSGRRCTGRGDVPIFGRAGTTPLYQIRDRPANCDLQASVTRPFEGLCRPLPSGGFVYFWKGAVMSLEDRFDMERQGGLTYLRQHYQLNPSELYVVNMLVRFDQGGACFPTQETIAWETGLPIRNVKRALDALAKKGVVTREKQPYYDKRGRFRAGKIYHYSLSAEVSFAVTVGHPQEEPRLPNRGQNSTNMALELPEQEPLLPDGGQNGTNMATELPAAPLLPNRGRNGTYQGAEMAPIGGQNGTHQGAIMAPDKEVKKETTEGNSEKIGLPSPADTSSSPKELFNQLIRDKSLVPEHRYYDVLGQVKDEITPLPTRESKDAQVMAWADRILAGEFADAGASALAAD